MRLSTDRLLAENVEADRKETMRVRAAEREALRAERLAKGESVDDIPPIVVNPADTESSNCGTTTSVGEETQSRIVLRSLDSYERKAVSWLWWYRFALGKLSLLGGDMGLGKTMIALYVAARLSRGESFFDTPDRANPIGDTIIVSCEDSPEDTLAPRLDALGADCSRIHFLEGVLQPEDKGAAALLALDRDTRLLRDALHQRPATRLIIFDPFSAYLGDSIDPHKDAQVRRVLGPLCELADEAGVCALGIMHLNKSSGTKALYRMLGSVAFLAAARCASVVVPDKEDPDRVLLLPLKGNVAKRPPGLAYRIVQAPTAIGSVGVVQWESGTVNTTVDEAMEADTPKPGRPPAIRQEAERLLQDMLTSGPRLEAEILRETFRRGIGERALKTAKKLLGVQSRNMVYGGLPDKCSWWFYPGTLISN